MNMSSGLGKPRFSSSVRTLGVSSCSTEMKASNENIMSPSLENFSNTRVDEVHTTMTGGGLDYLTFDVIP